MMVVSAPHSDQLAAGIDALTQSANLLHSGPLVRALDELTDSPIARQQAAINPAAFLRARGVKLSATARVAYSEFAVDEAAIDATTARRFTISVCDSIFVLGQLVVTVCRTYDSETGWHVSIEFK